MFCEPRRVFYFNKQIIIFKIVDKPKVGVEEYDAWTVEMHA